jgi:hypothetical protein
MSFILGMDYWVFLAWILTILSAIGCILYGIYYEFIKKASSAKDRKSKSKEVK